MNWNWDHLRFFLALANNGSLSEAARELSVSHTTVLRRVRSIEQALETHLFDHKSSGYCLTPAGDALFREVQKMKTTVDYISRQISGVDQQIGGPIVITTTDTLGFAFMPAVMRQLVEQYPELDITLKVSPRLSDMDNREADIAIRTCAQPPPHLVGRKLGQIRFNACASTEYAQEHHLTEFPQDLSTHRVIQLDDTYSQTPFHAWLAPRCAAAASVVTATSLLSAYGLSAAGVGITVLPQFLIEKDPSMRVLNTPDVIQGNDLWLLSHTDLRDTLRIRLVKRFLVGAFEQIFE